MDRRPQPQDVRVPKKCASLARNGEVVHIALTWLDRALRDVCWSVGPSSSELSDTMPIQDKI